jgi:hypothetical protein
MKKPENPHSFTETRNFALRTTIFAKKKALLRIFHIIAQNVPAETRGNPGKPGETRGNP